MSEPIGHPAEPKGNALRARLGSVTGHGQRTRTPTLAIIGRAEGARLWTADERELYDFAAGVLVANLGHQHKRFEERCQHYCKGLPRNSYNMATAIEVEAAEHLLCSTGWTHDCKVLWAASGSEAIQKAIWACQHAAPERPIMLATRHGFHGKKGLAGDVSGERSPNPNVRFVSFPMAAPYDPRAVQAELDALAEEFPGRIGLLITEPYLGAAGSWHPPLEYHQQLEAFCRAHGIPLIWDEVQSCHGRTGAMYAYQSYGVTPDLVCMGKGLANGEPCAAVVGRSSLIDALDFGEASDTFSGNPHACAAVRAVLDVFHEEHIIEKAQALAPVVHECVTHLSESFDCIEEVRGEGLVYGIQFTSAEAANAAVLEAYKGEAGKGVHFLGPLAKRVLRVSPPLIMTEAEFRDATALLSKVWQRIPEHAAATLSM